MQFPSLKEEDYAFTCVCLYLCPSVHEILKKSYELDGCGPRNKSVDFGDADHDTDP